MSCVCIIPARGGSKRLPRKNLRLLAGKPLLQYTIEAADRSGCFDDIFVSSDDEKILALARGCGVQTDVRSPEMSGDRVKAVEVVDEFLRRKLADSGWNEVGMCLPTCPLRSSEDVRRAVEIFRSNKDACPRLLGVCESDRPQLALKPTAGHLAEMREQEAYERTTRSQDMPRYYLPNGSIYLSTMEQYLETKTFFGNPTLYYAMAPERSFDIDYEYQFHLAQCMLEYLKENPGA